MSIIIYDEIQYAYKQKLWELTKSEQFCDVILIAGSEEKRISAHRSILSAECEYFNGMFNSSMRECKIKEIKLPILDSNALQSLIQYFYTGHVVIREDNVEELLRTADMLLLNNIVRSCIDFLLGQLNASNCLGYMELGVLYHSDELIQSAKTYSLKNFMEVYKTVEFLNLTINQLIDVLSSDDLRIAAEEHAFDSLMKWIAYDLSKRVKYKATLLKLVRLPLLEYAFLMEHIESICTSTECEQIFMDAIKWQSIPYGRKPYESNLVQPRKSNLYLLALTESDAHDKLYIHFYCAQQKKWMQWLKSIEFRWSFGLAVMENDLYIVGGYNQRKASNTITCMNLKTMTLKKVRNMRKCRDGCCAIALKGFLYVAGGITKGKDGITRVRSSVESWNPRSNKWNTVAKMLERRCNFGFAALNEKLYAIGGSNDFMALKSAECYDPLFNEWKGIASTMGFSYTAAVNNGVLYAMSVMKRAIAIECYDPLANNWTLVYRSCEGLSLRLTRISFPNKLICYYAGNRERYEEYNTLTNKWDKFISFDELDNVSTAISYFGKLAKAEFFEN